MSNWTARIFTGLGLMVLTPLAARLALPASHEPTAVMQQRKTDSEAEKSIHHVSNRKNSVRTGDNFGDWALSNNTAGGESRKQLQHTICDFLIEYSGGKKQPPTSYCTRKSANGNAPQVMIAILPDPVHTQLAVRFDRGIDDLENTVQQMGWRFDRAWLPWSNQLAYESSRFKDQVTDDSMRDAWEQQPGVLLFRPSTDISRPDESLVSNDKALDDGHRATTCGMEKGRRRKLAQLRAAREKKEKSRKQEAREPLVVFVVGDKPTAGVNAKQFLAALTAWKALRGHAQASGSEKLRILGPSFAGSGASLGHLLESGLVTKPCPKPLNVIIASGTVTREAALAGQMLAKSTCAKSFKEARSISFAIDLDYQHIHILKFLADHLHKHDEGIVELSEEESAFGERENLLDKTRKDIYDTRAAKLADENELYEAETEFISKVTEPEWMRVKTAIGKVKAQENWLSEDRRLMCFLRTLQFGNPSLGGPNEPDPSLECPKVTDHEYKARVIQMQFPREISLLRKAYEQNGILGFGVSKSDGPRTQLRLNFQEDAKDDDSVTSFAGTQGAISLEGRLAQMAATLETDNVKIALLSATDVLDEIFVARYLMQHAPGVTIVVQDTDLMFLRSGSDATMDGVYALAAYPLIPDNGRWSANVNDSKAEPLSEPSQGDQGIVNATSYLLCSKQTEAVSGLGCQALTNRDGQPAQGKAEHNGTPRSGFAGTEPYLWLDEYQPPFPLDRMPNGAIWDNDFKLQPPLWLSVIGHGGFQPVSLVDLDDAQDKFPESLAENLPRLANVESDDFGMEKPIGRTTPAGIKQRTPLILKFVAALLLALFVLHTWACLSCRLDRTYAWSYAAADSSQWPWRVAIQAGLCMLCIVAAELLTPPSVPGALVQEDPLFSHCMLLFQIAAACIATATVWRHSPISLKKVLKDLGDPKGVTETIEVHSAVQIAAAAATAVVGVGIIAVAHFYLWNWLAPDPYHWTERIFFFYRSALLLRGASPVMPLLLLLSALAFWMYGYFGKMLFSGGRIPMLPSRGENLRCPQRHWVRKLNTLLDSRWTWTGTKTLLAAASVACVLSALAVSNSWGPESLAWGRYDVVVDWLVAIVATLVLHNLLVASFAWQKLKGEVLLPLKQSPLRWGFNWIRGFSWKRLWTTPEGSSPEAQLEFVMRNVESQNRWYERRDVTKAYNNLLRKYEDRKWKSHMRWSHDLTSLLGDLYKALATEAGEKIDSLSVEWSFDHGPLTGTDAARGFQDEQDPASAATSVERINRLKRAADEEFVALVYLNYIRIVIVQIRDRIGISVGMYVLLLWAMTSYPWMNRHAILLELCAMLAVIAFVSIKIYAEMQRDDILSRTTETKPGKLDGEFFVKILTVVGIPALSLAASQFPEFSNLIFSWLEPGLSTMK